MSKTGDHWTTPIEVIDAIVKFNGGPIALDPCSNPNSIVGALTEWYGPPHGKDGLVLPWTVGGLVYWNPPYSDKPSWARRATEQFIYAKVESIGLIPADTDTDWFFRYCWTAPRRSFWKGRLKFGGDTSYGARFPSVLVYHGRRVSRFNSYFWKLGHCC
jgi:hypothetical protein